MPAYVFGLFVVFVKQLLLSKPQTVTSSEPKRAAIVSARFLWEALLSYKGQLKKVKKPKIGRFPQ